MQSEIANRGASSGPPEIEGKPPPGALPAVARIAADPPPSLAARAFLRTDIDRAKARAGPWYLAALRAGSAHAGKPQAFPSLMSRRALSLDGSSSKALPR